MMSKLAKSIMFGLLLVVWGTGYSEQSETTDDVSSPCAQSPHKMLLFSGDKISYRIYLCAELPLKMLVLKDAVDRHPLEMSVLKDAGDHRSLDVRDESLKLNGLVGLIALFLAVLLGYIFGRKGASRAVVNTDEPDIPALHDYLKRLVAVNITDDDFAHDGTDSEALRGYLKRLVSVDLAIDDFARDDADSEALQVIKVLAEDALDSCGVTTFSPKIGENYLRAEGVAEHPKTQVTDKPEDKFKIAEVLEKGYKMKTPEGYKVIYPARVRIFITS